jgi:predicted nucleotidyltransferase component of viral defense system
MMKEWIETYKPRNNEEVKQALREIMQEIALAGLYRANFFEHAAFYGETALRIFYGLPRFSEDLDFSLLKTSPDFKIDSYLHFVLREFESLGLNVTIKNKIKSKETAIESAFLKTETYWKELVLNPSPGIPDQQLHIKIKFEVDTNPPLGFDTEEKLLLKPFSCYIKCFSAADLFAGKMHALLFRKWKNRVKGRDWYDMEWYVRNGFEINLSHLRERAIQSGDWKENMVLGKEELYALLYEKIGSVSFDRIKEDVVRFVKQPEELNIWSAKYFSDLVRHIKL